MPRCTQSKKFRFFIHSYQLGQTHLYLFFPDMKGALGFIGVFLSFLSGAAGEYNSSIVCGNDTEKCLEFCSICQFSFEGKIMQCLSLLVTHVCVLNFEDQMNSLKNTDWCIWHNVNSLYSNISICTEDISDCLMIPWPNALVEQIFVDIHSRYFKDCPSEELRDPSPATVFALVITPICLIPIMVSLVVLKTKNGDGSSS